MKNYSYVRTGIYITVLFFSSSSTIGNTEETTQSKPQKCEQQISLETFRGFALNNSFLVAEIDRDYANNLATAFETETLQNPELQAEQTFTRMKLAGANDPQAQVSIGQPLRLSNFGSRSEVARLIRKSGDLQKRVKLMELIQKLTLQYETLAAYQQVETILRDAENRAAKKVSLIKEGVKKGLLSDGDKHLFEGEKYRLQARAKSVASTISALRSELSKSIGFPCEFDATFRSTLEALPTEQALIQRAKESQIGESSRIDLLLDLTKEQVRLAELDAFPQITPRLVYQHTNDGGDFFGAGISIPLPFWNQNQGERYKANAERKAAETRSTFRKNGGLENQIITLREAVINAEEQAQLFTKKVIPSFGKAFEAQEKLYAQGKGSVLQVWQTLTTFNEVQTQGLQLTLEARSLRIQLSILVGEEI
jgi:outer membrane protein TolC